MLSTSLKPGSRVTEWPPKWIISQMTFQNYVGIFRDYDYVFWLRNSSVVSLCATVLTILLGSLAAYGYSRFEFKGKNILYLFTIAMIIVPQEVLLVPLFMSFTKIGMGNTYISLVLPVIANPMSIFLFRQFFDGFPQELEDAARIDGCTTFRIYFEILMPLSASVIIAVAIISFTTAWNDMIWPIIISSSKKTATLAVGMVQNFEAGARIIQFGHQGAMAILCILPTVGVFLVLQKYIALSEATTGIKG